MESKEWGEEPEREAAKRFPLWAKVAIGLCLCIVPCIGLLATLVVPNVVRKLSVAAQAQAQADIMALRFAVDSCAIEHSGRYPDSLEALIVPDSAGSTYLARDSVPVDPWGRPYGYEPPAEGKEARIFTLGKDGKPGGEGDDRDLDDLLIRDGKL